MDFRSYFDAVEWDTLTLSVVLACADALPDDAAEACRGLEENLARIGGRARSQIAEGRRDDLALAVLASLSDAAVRHDAVMRVAQLLRAAPAAVVHGMTEAAATLVDRVCPDQSFTFRATMVLVSMAATTGLMSP